MPVLLINEVDGLCNADPGFLTRLRALSEQVPPRCQCVMVGYFAAYMSTRAQAHPFFHFVHGEIGRKAERAGFDTVSRRVHVGARRKLALVARSLGPNGGAKRRRNLAPVSLATSQWLVDAASQPAPRDGSHRKALRDQYVWLLDTFEKLDRFHRSGQVSSAGG